MLVVDESRSILQRDMIDLFVFLVGLVQEYRVSEDETQIGLILFSNEARTKVEIPLNRYHNQTELIDRITEIFPPLYDNALMRGAETHHLRAMMLAVDELSKNGRDDASDFIVFLTDGIPETIPPENSYTQSAVNFSRIVRDSGTTIIGIYAGSANRDQGTREIQQISSDGRAFSVNFDELNQITTEIVAANCTGNLKIIFYNF